ncbi:MAG: hypothetical protein HQL23_05580 [Candidatus Omnitrophica bacterium]|nr:hypothetical protein [Candidatus Omnitrophota bacterium]
MNKNRKSQHKPLPQNQGTILVEALIAVSILSVSIVIILQSLTTASRAFSRAESYTEAADILDNKMSEFLLSAKLFSDEKNDPVEGNLHNYSVQLTQTHQPFDEKPGLQILTMGIEWEQGDTKNKMTSQSVYYDKAQ